MQRARANIIIQSVHLFYSFFFQTLPAVWNRIFGFFFFFEGVRPWRGCVATIDKRLTVGQARGQSYGIEKNLDRGEREYITEVMHFLLDPGSRSR